jgi:hypothetical protein
MVDYSECDLTPRKQRQVMIDRSDMRDGLEPTCRGGVTSDGAGNVRKK